MKKKILTLLVLLMTVVTGAWAQTTDEVVVNPAATANQWTFEMIDADIELEVEYYTVEELYEMGVELTDNGDGTWTLSETPAFDIELEIKYYKDPNLAWKIGTEDVPTEGVTAYTGFPFTAPTLVNDSNLTVIYQSTYPNVATIGANGTIAILNPGTTTIKASYPGDDTYQEDTASYQLTVLAPAVLTLASNNSEWGSVTLNTGTTLPEGVIAGETEGTFRVIPDTGVTLNADPETGYHFVQWNDGNTDNPRTVSLVSDSTFTASFAPDTFTVTYMNGTAQLKVEKVPYRESIPEYTPSKQGRTFDGWTPTLPELMPAENLTTYAQWTCDSVLDIDENKYPAVNIGNKCWMAENLRTRHYADGREIAHIYEYHTTMNPTVPQNYGYLYDWYDAVDVNRPATRATSSTYVQGVCPENYHIPTAEEVALLINLPANALCSTDGWITPDGITNSANFTAYPAGLYNTASARFEGRGTQTDWWIVNGTTSNIRDLQNVSSLQINYFCNAPQIITRNPNDAVSVRCVLND